MFFKETQMKVKVKKVKGLQILPKLVRLKAIFWALIIKKKKNPQ